MSPLASMDIGFLFYLAEHVRSDLLNPIFIFITHLGDSGLIWILIALLCLARPKTRRCGVSIAVALVLCLLLGNGLIKNVVARPRPFAAYPELTILIPRPGEYSFPSGHTLSSFAAAAALFQFYKKPGAAAFVLAALIGFSRLYVGVHYPTDVLTGAVLGVFLGTAAAVAVCRIAEDIHFARIKRADQPEKKPK